MNTNTLILATIVLFIAVALGAFGAHGLKALVTPEALGQWRTGVEYQFYHGLAMLFIGLAGASLGDRVQKVLRILFLCGILFFCGSLYLLSTRAIIGTDALTPIFGPITPIGGLFFLAGWAFLGYSAWRAKPIE